MGALDGETGRAWGEPGEAVLPIAGVVDGRRPARGREKAQLMQRDVIEGGKEDFTEGAVDQRVPQLALRSGRCPERHLASRTPHRRGARASWWLHRGVSRRRGRGG